MSNTDLQVGSMTADEYGYIRSEIGLQTDRGAAIVACSFLEEHLSWSINSKFVKLSDRTMKRLFEGTLGSLFHRSYFGYALGLYDREAREEIIRIGEIRNLFAHRFAPMTFSDNAVTTLCNKLHYPRLHKDTIGNNASNREKYLHSCWILRALITRHATPEEDKPKSPDHGNLLGVLAESLSGLLPHDKSAEPHQSQSQTQE